MVWGDGWSNRAATAAANTFGLIANFVNFNGGTYTIEGLTVGNDTTNSWSVTQLDPYTVRHEIRSGDHWSASGGGYSDGTSVERCETSTSYTLLDEGQLLNWEATITVLSGGSVPNDDFFGLVQLHASTNVDPTYSPISIQLEGTTEKLRVILQNPSNGFIVAYTAPSAVVRDVPMDLKIKGKMGPTGNAGSILITLDGNTIVNLPAQSVGATASTYYWKWGLYRTSAPSTMKADFSHVHRYIG